MPVYVNNTYRIRRSAAQQEDMQRLSEANIFDGYKDILMISAIIGYNFKQYKPIEKVASDGVLMQFFTHKDYDIMDIIAYAHTKEQSIIKRDEKYEIFSSYANGGFPILLNMLGIEDLSNISDDDAKRIKNKYYSMLLNGDFNNEVNINEEDLFI